MPAYGLINDSPIFYYGAKWARSYNKALRRKNSSSTMGKAAIVFNIRYKNLILYKPILNRELNLPGGIVWPYMDRMGKRIVMGAKRQVGVKTGVLRASIHMRHLGNVTGQYLWIGSRQPHAYLHHEGTRPHIILPKNPGGVLVFAKAGRVVRTSVVKHPGTKPNRYLSDQLRIHVTR